MLASLAVVPLLLLPAADALLDEPLEWAEEGDVAHQVARAQRAPAEEPVAEGWQALLPTQPVDGPSMLAVPAPRPELSDAPDLAVEDGVAPLTHALDAQQEATAVLRRVPGPVPAMLPPARTHLAAVAVVGRSDAEALHRGPVSTPAPLPNLLVPSRAVLASAAVVAGISAAVGAGLVLLGNYLWAIADARVAPPIPTEDPRETAILVGGAGVALLFVAAVAVAIGLGATVTSEYFQRFVSSEAE